MYFNIEWKIKIGDYQLGLLESIEIHKSVDLLADTCVIKLPGSAHGKTLSVEGKVKPGDRVTVQLGYSQGTEKVDLPTEFEGYLQRIDTDDGSLIFNCEDDLYLLRKPVKDKEFKKTSVKNIAQYVINETKCGLGLNCTMDKDAYDKFVISYANGFDVLKKIQEETKYNIYIKNGILQIHPPYIEKFGDARYSFQQNIESSDLKYRKSEDRKVLVIVENTAPDGKKIEVRAGTTGGEEKRVKGDGMSKAMMEAKAKNEHTISSYDGYEGSITGWLIPYLEPGYTIHIKDEDYDYKNGGYYTVAVTTTVSSNGGIRKVQLGRRLL